MELSSQALCKYSPVVMETMYLSKGGWGGGGAAWLTRRAVYSSVLLCPEFDGVVFKRCFYMRFDFLMDVCIRILKHASRDYCLHCL